MRIRVVAIVDGPSGMTVELTCAVGAARARWEGARRPPIGAELDVELDSNEPVVVTVVESAPAERLTVVGDRTVLIAPLHSVSAKGELGFLIGADGFLRVATTSAAPAIGAWLRVELPAFVVFDVRP